MGILYIVPTPIGNLQDITIRSLDILFSVPYIACEDTRKTGNLLKLLKEKYPFQHIPRNNGLEQQLIPYYDQVEKERIPHVLHILTNDFDVALVSDAGTPLISDPGFKLIRACHEFGIHIVALPGASSVIVALAASGLPTDKFSFFGYPPEKSGHRKTFYENIKKSSEIFSTTYIIFEAPHKIEKTLVEMENIFGNIDLVLCRELTKLHEEIFKGTIEDAKRKFKHPKGEFVILFHL